MARTLPSPPGLQQQLAREYIQHVLDSTGETATGLARRIKTNASTITRFMNNPEVTHTITIQNLYKIAEESGIPLPEELLSAYGLSAPTTLVNNALPKPNIDKAVSDLRNVLEERRATQAEDEARPKGAGPKDDSGTVNHPVIRSQSARWDNEPSEQEAPLPVSNVSPADMPGRLDPFRAKRVPLLGMAQGGGDGSFILNTGEPIMFVERPIGLAGRDRVYALRVEGNSMYPIHEDGDLIFVDPGRKAYPGRDAVIELYSEHDFENQTRALLKRIVAVNGEFVIVKEMQPKEREFRIPRTKIKALHLVLKNSEMY